jgi:3-hydroxybutyryl-CoA dehydratase
MKLCLAAKPCFDVELGSFFVGYIHRRRISLVLNKIKLGRNIDEITIGEKFTATEKMEDKELLLYLGLTNDANPLYIQHDYASKTSYKKPIVPNIMLLGIITSAVSKYLPGPGSHILSQNIQFPAPVYHYETVTIHFEVQSLNKENNLAEITVRGVNEQNEVILKGVVIVSPPLSITGING